MRFSRGDTSPVEKMPTRVYRLRFDGVVETREFPSKKYEGEVDVSLWVQLVVDDPASEWDGEGLRIWTPEYYADGTKTGKLWAAILGVEQLPAEIDEDMLKNRPFYATVSVNEKGYYQVESPYADAPPATTPMRQRRLAKDAIGVANSLVGVGNPEPPFSADTLIP